MIHCWCNSIGTRPRWTVRNHSNHRDLLTENRECNERLERLIATIKQLDDLTFDQLAAGPRSDCPLLELDGWKLRRVLGRGGSGIVFAAEKDGQLAAVKAILRER